MPFEVMKSLENCVIESNRLVEQNKNVEFPELNYTMQISLATYFHMGLQS